MAGFFWAAVVEESRAADDPPRRVRHAHFAHEVRARS
jgi:hypothetical protein